MQIQDIKERLTLQQVLSHYNLKPDRNSRLCCPFHSDKTPSLQVYHETNTVYCFSSNCKTHGKSLDVIDFIMHKGNVNKHEAIEKAKELCGGNASNIKQANSTTQVKPNTELLTKLFKSFQNGLKSGKANKPKEYLQQRLLNAELLELGYNSGQFHHRGKLSEEDRKACIDAGLLIEYKGYTPNGNEKVYTAFAKDCIIFPLRNKQNEIVSIYGRSLSDKKGTKHYYLKSRSGLYPCYPSCPGMGSGAPRLILTEAIIDAATLLQLPKIKKQYQVLSLYGTNGLTEEHKQALSETNNLQEIIFFFDGDGAGRAAIEKYSQELKELLPNAQLSKVETPGGEDVNSLHLAYNNEEYFLELLEERKPLTQPNNLFLSTESRASTRNNSIEKKKETKQAAPEPQVATKLITTNPEQLIYETNELKITIWGGIEIHTINRLRATLHIKLTENEHLSFRDTVDLYSHSQSDRLIKQASEKLEISSSIVSQVITGLTKELENYRQQKREEKRKNEESKEQQGIDRFSREQMQQANEFIGNSDLSKLTHGLFSNLGMVGQQDNATLLFFIFLTRFFKNPLHAIVMGSSGSGKTHLLQGVAKTVPKQHINVTTSLSENTLYYTPKDFLKNKILMQEDLDGAYNALLPLRELMSNQSISRFSTKTNSRTGDSKQVYLHVEGPVCVAGATTKDKVYEDNANRSFLIQIEENPKHEAQVMEYQGRVAAGLINFKTYERNIDLLKACQMLIKPMEVLIPFAPKLELPPHVFKKMRTKNHYLTLIKSVTLWNQKQRKITTDKEGNKYLISTLEDVQWSNFLCKDNLLRKSDELGGKTRNFFESLKELVKQWDARTFYAKDVRKYLRMHPMTLQRHFVELERRGLLKCVSRSNKPGNEYEINVWDDFEQLKSGMDIMDTILEELKSSEPSHNLHTTFTK